MTEGDRIPNNLLEEVAGKPREPQPLTIFQEASLAWWDNVEIPRLENLMKEDREQFRRHREWERRQFDKDHLGR